MVIYVSFITLFEYIIQSDICFKCMWLHSNYSHLSDLHLLSLFIILQSITFQSCDVVRHFPVLQIQVTRADPMR